GDRERPVVGRHRDAGDHDRLTGHEVVRRRRRDRHRVAHLTGTRRDGGGGGGAPTDRSGGSRGSVERVREGGGAGGGQDLEQPVVARIGDARDRDRLAGHEAVRRPGRDRYRDNTGRQRGSGRRDVGDGAARIGKARGADGVGERRGGRDRLDRERAVVA